MLKLFFCRLFPTFLLINGMPQVFMGEYGDPHLAKDPAKLQADLERARALVEDKTNPFAP